jgi:hypothetical protein
MSPGNLVAADQKLLTLLNQDLRRNRLLDPVAADEKLTRTPIQI